MNSITMCDAGISKNFVENNEDGNFLKINIPQHKCKISSKELKVK